MDNLHKKIAKARVLSLCVAYVSIVKVSIMTRHSISKTINEDEYKK